MARYPGATWRPISVNYTPRGMNRVLGVVVHIMQGTLDGTDSWFRNPKAQASSHVGIGKSGTVYQWVDTVDKAWAQAAGNPSWISIEFEGRAGESLTTKQIVSAAHFYAWCVKTHPNIPVQLSERPAIGGLGYHRMGGTAWGNHPCPGQPIIDQRAGILALVHTILTPGEAVRPEYTPPIVMEPIVSSCLSPSGGVWAVAASGAVYALEGAPFHGGMNGDPNFRGRKAAKIEPEVVNGHPTGFYVITATSDEKYVPKKA